MESSQQGFECEVRGGVASRGEGHASVRNRVKVSLGGHFKRGLSYRRSSRYKSRNLCRCRCGVVNSPSNRRVITSGLYRRCAVSGRDSIVPSRRNQGGVVKVPRR